MLREILTREVVRLGNGPFRRNEIAHAPGKTHFVVVLALLTLGFEGSAGLATRVGEELVRKACTLSKGFLVLDGVEACPKDDAVCGFKVGGSITEPLSLKRSTRG